MDANAIALARELKHSHPREREVYYERTGVPTALRAAVEAILSESVQTFTSADERDEPLSEIETFVAQPTLIGRYKVIKLLGRGGMGEVYLAHDPVLDREVAVKLIGGGIDDPNARRRLVEEARAAGRLRHPNIVTIFDAGEHEGNPYIAMEHVIGETLRGLIKRRAPMSQGRKLALMEGACAGLAHAHRANVVHLDVKPDNLMVDAHDGLKVLDFGVARVLKSEALVTQHVAGTLRYMSPEQLTGRPIDRRSDVFSLGCSLFEFIAYVPAYAGTAHEIMARITAGPVPHLSDVMPDVHPTLDALIFKAMALDPAERFDDLDELARALRRFGEQREPAHDAGQESRSSATFMTPRRATAPVVSRPQHAALAVIGVALALAVGLSAVWMWRPAATPQRQSPPSPVTQQTVAPDRIPPPPSQSTAQTDAPIPPTTATRPPASSTTPATSGQREAKSDLNASATTGTRIIEPPTPGQPPSDDAEGIRPTPQPTTQPAAPIASAPIAAEKLDTQPIPTLPNTKVAAPIDETNEVLAVLRRYRDAYAALDVSALQRIYPTLATSTVEEIRRGFEDSRTHEVALSQPRVDVRNNTAIVRALVTRRIVPKVGSPQSIVPVETEFRLQRDERGWIITDVKANPGK